MDSLLGSALIMKLYYVTFEDTNITTLSEMPWGIRGAGPLAVCCLDDRKFALPCECLLCDGAETHLRGDCIITIKNNKIHML